MNLDPNEPRTARVIGLMGAYVQQLYHAAEALYHAAEALKLERARREGRLLSGDTLRQASAYRRGAPPLTHHQELAPHLTVYK